MKNTPSTLDDYIAAQGRRGDTLIAHLSKKEAGLLKKMGGSGSINPKTGMLEFWDADSDASADAAAEAAAGRDESSDPSTDAFGGNFGANNFGGGEHSFGNLDVSIGPQDPGYFSGATGMPGETGMPSASFTGGPEIGKTVEGMAGSLGEYGRAALIGFGVMGPPGILVGPGIKALKDSIMSGEFGNLSPEEQARAIATAEGAMPSGGLGGGGGEIGGAGTTTEAILGPQMQELEKMYKRSIAQEPYTYNLQMAGLSPRDVLPVRRY